jgi:hypothetical protein
MTGKRNGFDEKNIRRRIYDALNVLMAMDIITKVTNHNIVLLINTRLYHYMMI